VEHNFRPNCQKFLLGLRIKRSREEVTEMYFEKSFKRNGRSLIKLTHDRRILEIGMGEAWKQVEHD